MIRFVSFSLLTLFAFPALVLAQLTQVQTSGGEELNGLEVSDVSISGDGSTIIFSSGATNAVDGDTNGVNDIFAYDVETRVMTRISVSSDGVEGNGGSFQTQVSFDGRYVVFRSEASNLVAGDTNATSDCFLHDRTTGETTRVSVASDGTEGNNTCLQPAVSDDATYVVFTSTATNLGSGDTNGVSDIYEHVRVTGETRRLSVNSADFESDGASTVPSISRDGRFVAFQSSGSNFVPGDTNGVPDIIVYDRETGIRKLISINASGVVGDSQSNRAKLSPDGTHVVFDSFASNLVDGDTNGTFDGFLYDLSALYDSSVTGLTRLFAVNGNEGDANTGFCFPNNSAEFVACLSFSTNLVDSDTNAVADIFTQEISSGSIQRVSVQSEGVELDGTSATPSITALGDRVVFESDATNALAGETTGLQQVYYTGNDRCREDPNKLEPGVCGCGVRDTDANGNGNADCLDPTAESTPNAPTLDQVNRKKISVEMDEYEGATVTYRVRARARVLIDGRRRRVTRNRTSSAADYEFAGLKKASRKQKARWTVDYTVSAGSDTTGRSGKSRIRF